MQILKFGGSVITRKEGYLSADHNNISALAKTIASVRKKGVRDIVIVHGAGSFGHALVLKYGINNGVHNEMQKHAYAKTHFACEHLSTLIVDELLHNDVPAISLPPASFIIQKNKRIVKFDTSVIESYLSRGFVPVLYGDMVLDEKIVGSVCSGDQIVSYLGKKAKRMILGTNVDGVLAEGRVVPLITRKNFAEIARHITGSATPDVTGGMAGKIREIMLVKRPTYIVNAKKPSRMEALLLGKKAVCTEIKF